jgi:hypothetical protein
VDLGTKHDANTDQCAHVGWLSGVLRTGQQERCVALRSILSAKHPRRLVLKPRPVPRKRPYLCPRRLGRSVFGCHQVSVSGLRIADYRMCALRRRGARGRFGTQKQVGGRGFCLCRLGSLFLRNPALLENLSTTNIRHRRGYLPLTKTIYQDFPSCGLGTRGAFLPPQPTPCGLSRMAFPAETDGNIPCRRILRGFDPEPRRFDHHNGGTSSC